MTQILETIAYAIRKHRFWVGFSIVMMATLSHPGEQCHTCKACLMAQERAFPRDTNWPTQE